jgi:epsin
MDFMKVFDQTVREIKREVNLKVLKVPEIEQKVLDATDNEPWGPHGTALADIAQATKKFTECQLVMNVLWTRLTETGKDWRYVYKSLAVIEYLVSNGSERAVDDIIEHTFQISSLTSFEYVEPNGKDSGLNVRKKAETIVGLLNNKEKIQEVRNKAATNRDKYVGLSSTGITFKSGAATSFGSGSSQSSERYGGFGSSRNGDRFADQYKEEKSGHETYAKTSVGVTNENQGYSSKKGSTKHDSKAKGNGSFKATKSIPAPSSSLPSNECDDDFDDFDPRGTSGAKHAAANPPQVDLFGDSLIDLLDVPTSAPAEESSSMHGNSSNVDLFADATFVSAPPQGQPGETFVKQPEGDLFASVPTIPVAALSTVDLFASPVLPETKAPKSESINTAFVDPFAAVPLRSFDGSDSFGLSTTHSESAVPAETKPNHTNDDSFGNFDEKYSKETVPKKNTFQVKSGIWADSLSRGLIDLNISAPKKVSLVDVGVMGGLSDGFEEKEKGRPTSHYMGQAMGTGSGLGRSGSGFTSSQGTDMDDFFSSRSSSSHQSQFGNFQK